MNIKNDKTDLENERTFLKDHVPKEKKGRCFWKNTIKYGLLASALVFGCVQGDVCHLTAAMGGAPFMVIPGAGLAAAAPAHHGSFDTFITGLLAVAAAGGVPIAGAFPVGAFNNFAVGGPWGMLGYSVFFPAGVGVAQRVYVAKKQNGALIANNDPLAGGHVWNYSPNIHTERQLAIAALEDAVAAAAGVGLMVPGGGGGAPGLAAVGALPVAAAGAIPGGGAALAGTLHICTFGGAPCTNPVPNNGLLTCWEYYEELANAFPGINFEIYAPDNQTVLNAAFILRSGDACCALLDATAAAIPGGTILAPGGVIPAPALPALPPLKSLRNTPAGNLEVFDGVNFVVLAGRVGGAWNVAAAIAGGNVNRLRGIVNALPIAIRAGIFTAANKAATTELAISRRSGLPIGVPTANATNVVRAALVAGGVGLAGIPGALLAAGIAGAAVGPAAGVVVIAPGTLAAAAIAVANNVNRINFHSI